MRIRRDGIRCGLLVLAIAASTAIVEPQSPSTLDPILQLRSAQIDGRSDVVITADSEASADLLAALIVQSGGRVGRRLPIIHGIAATVSNPLLSIFAVNPYVHHVSVDRQVGATMARTAATIGATTVRQQFGLDGSGVGIAIIDSGIVSWHDDLTDPAVAGSQRVDRFIDFVNQAAVAYDDFGHGTHVAGIIAGNGFDSNGSRAGIAPAARLVLLKVLDGNGHGRISDVIAAFDYVVSHQTECNIRLINLSVGAGVYESYNVDPLTLAAKRAVDQGIVVVAAAGNLGRAANGQPQYGGITAPGNAPWVLTVGASSHMGTVDRSDDIVAPFSSRGPTAIDRGAKPDLVAPGVGTESLSAPGSTLYNGMGPYLVSGTVPTPFVPYLSLSGTSMSAPLVTGTVALMLQADPQLTPNAVKAILQFTAQIYPGYDAFTQGAGFLNARGAVELTRFLASTSATSVPAGTQWGHRLVWAVSGARPGLTLALTGPAAAPSVITTAPGILGVRMAPAPVAACSVNCFDLSTWRAWAAGLTTAVDLLTQPGAYGAPPGATIWGTGDSGETVVWGSTDGGETVVWGSNDRGETVVWGSTGGETVVWGSTDRGETVVWGSTCTDPSCQPVVWGGSK